MFQFFRTAPFVEEIKDQELVHKNYKYWRLRIFMGIYVGYAFYYFTRKSFTFAMPSMQAELGLGKFELGLLASVLSISYGISKFLSGIICDRSNPRYFMSIGLMLTGIFNLLFGASSALWAFAIFWGLNGWFQGWGATGCAKILMYWYSHSERGRWWSVWNTSHNLGGALIPLLAPFCATMFGWRYAMYVPGIICLLGGCYLMYSLRDTPQSLGLPSIEKYRNEPTHSKAADAPNTISTREILFEYILKNKYIWVLALAFFCIYVIRMAVNDWSMLYLMEVKNYTSLTAGFCVCWFEIGGFFGSLAAGWSSDLIFKGKRNPINVLFTVAILVLLFSFKMFSAPIPFLDAMFLFLFGFFIFGPQMLIGMAAVELCHKKAAATATGFVGCFAYLGAAVAGAPLGAITKNWGWESYLLTLFICGTLAALLLLPLWSVKTNPKEETMAAEEASSS